VIMTIKACLNGPRGREEHPAVPTKPHELATAAAEAVAAGAQAIHMHPRADNGGESLAAIDIGAAVRAVRLASPRVPVGVSTGLWIAHGDAAARQKEIFQWATLAVEERPDFASVNLSEPGFSELASALELAGIAVEAGVWSPADAEALAASAPSGLIRILVEVSGSRYADGISAADAILGRLDDLGLSGPRLLHGHGATCWPLVAHAGWLGLSTRIGLEDTLVGPTGEPAVDNADLVRMALTCWKAAGDDRD
jgi:uncharacterized protein (DUF849 family)